MILIKSYGIDIYGKSVFKSFQDFQNYLFYFLSNQYSPVFMGLYLYLKESLIILRKVKEFGI